MTGQQPLIEMRRVGKRSSDFVWIVDAGLTSLTAKTWHEHKNPFDGRYYPEVQLTTQDMPQLLDLRFSVGLIVMVATQGSQDRAKQLLEAFKAAKAKRVIVNLFTDNKNRSEWVCCMDSDTILDKKDGFNG